MKPVILALMLLSLVKISTAQQSKIDSFYNILNSEKPDSLKAKAANELGIIISENNGDSSLLIFNQGLAFAQKSKHPITEAIINTNISFVYSEQGDLNKSEEFLLKAAEIYKSNNASKKLSYTYFILGTFQLNYHNYLKAEEYLLQAAYYGKPRNNYFGVLGSIHNNIGLVYGYMGQRLKSIEYKIKAIEYKEKAGMLGSALATSINNLAAEYNTLGDTAEAIIYYKKALDLLYNDTSTTKAACLKDYSEMLLNLNQLNKAKRHINELYELADHLSDSLYLAIAYVEKGNLAVKQNSFSEAYNFFNKAKGLKPQLYSDRFSIQLNLSLAKYYWESNTANISLAIDYAKNALEKSEQLNELQYQIQALGILKDGFLKLQKTDEALLYTNKFLKINDSLYSTEKNLVIADIKYKYETEKKELEIALLTNKNELNAVEIEQAKEKEASQNRYLLLTIIGLALLVAFTSLLVIQVQKKNKANSQLALKNQQVNKQNDEKELLLKEIHHRVKNNLQVVSSLLEVQGKNADEKTKVSIVDGQSRVRAMALIHEKLYQNENIASIDFGEYSQQLSRQIASLFPEKRNIKIDISTHKIALDIDTAVPLGLILNELITNAFKYGLEKNGQLQIALDMIENDHYVLVIKDNGTGLPVEFDLKKAKSLGLRLVNRLSKQLYGSVQYQSNGGAEFSITFKDTLQRKKIA